VIKEDAAILKTQNIEFALLRLAKQLCVLL